MAIVLFILIAGLWAAFLLPSFFDHRNQGPKSTTRDYARAKQSLGSVAASRPDSPQYVRRHAQRRRTGILIALGATAIVTLFVATWTASMAWLWATIFIDVAIATYITVLLTIKQQRSVPRATVVPIAAAMPVAAASVSVEPESYGESTSVRVIAG